MKSYTLLLTLCLSFLVGCTEPIRPEFDFKSGLVSVEGFVSTTLGGSSVTISQLNAFNVGTNSYENIFISGAEVSFINTDTGNEVGLTEDIEAEVYLPPTDFLAKTGETWELSISLADGRQYKSFPETMEQSVPISAIAATYDPELTYNLGFDDFVPGHSIQVDFEDPPDSENYYFWNYRSFEPRIICKTCYEVKIYREGECVWAIPPERITPEDVEAYPYWTYRCESDCWQIRYNQNISIFADEHTNGAAWSKLPVANVLLYNKRDILVELRQISLSAAAYQYYETLKDIVDDNGGFNSPPSAALVGNMFNPNNADEFVLGRFTAAPAEIARVFIKRSHITERSLILDVVKQEGQPPPPGLLPEEWVFYAPCPEESRYNTSNKPEGWPY
ncbi:DUF4249 domain-containing protein [Flagellimonas eckloniae]|uniref:DUF4249 domain-containing protein n=1 Tax=Flagellimonas eckloniae TaxID=346185 RepID=A0A0Q0XLY1_9FLAO|nr:DUF4249 domain-containing protein [Allomuricauda eckloniae]KQC30034.1 hypothetical protein AAY42_09210 [Allomuricauda eckloniae]